MTIVPAENTSWAIEVMIDKAVPIRLAVDTELLIGRIDPSETVFAGFDLTPFEGVDKGVSRHHAVIRREGDKLFVVDLTSGNGTFIDGVRLQPDKPARLTDGAKMQFGRLEMTIHLNPSLSQTSIRAARANFSTNQTLSEPNGQQILILEDDMFVADLYHIALEKVGFTTQMCRDVVSAIRAFNKEPPALLLIDLRLPSMPGIELCRYVRRDTDFPNVPVVIASATTDPETVQEAMDAQADVFLSKPVNLKELVRVVTALVSKAEADDSNLTTRRLSGTAALTPRPILPRRDTLVLFVNGHREPLSLSVEAAVTLGRRAPDALHPPIHNFLNLEPYDAFEKGVSRIHARIRRHESSFLVEDLGSANGTFINGQSLNQKENQALNNGDELRLGELRMQVFFLEDPKAK